MIFARRSLLLLLAMLLGGCDFFPSAERQLDEQKDPYFKVGKSRVKLMDYKGAIEAFEKALESNPRSAAAHMELGLLYEERENDYAIAIHHYNRFLKLRPDSEHAEILRSRVVSCKQELAKSVSLSPITQTMQSEIQRLTAENSYLKKQLEIWQTQMTSRTNVAAVFSPSMPVRNPRINPSQDPQPAPPAQPAYTQAPAPSVPAPAAPVASRTYTVKRGDTIASIARNHGVKEDRILAANPGVYPRTLQIGKVLVIPRQ